MRERGGRRLERQGRIVTDADGCTSVEVGVPCAGCAAPCGTPRRPWRLPSAALTAEPAGSVVRLSVSARGLNAALTAVFGPALLVFGALALVAPHRPAAAVLLGCLGLPLALALGRRLGGRSGNLLDLRASPVSGELSRATSIRPDTSEGDRVVMNQEVR